MADKLKAIDKIPEFHTKGTDDEGGTIYHVVCAYCGKDISYKHSRKPERCPHCGASDYRKPKTETMLFSLQRKYLENRDEKTLSQMYLILRDYAQSIIKKHLPRDFTYHYGHVEEKASDAANLLIENYLSKPNFSVENSFAGYLQWRVKEVLWNKRTRREENHESLNVHVAEENADSPELLEFASYFDGQTVGELNTNPNGDPRTNEVENSVFNAETNRQDLEAGLLKLLQRIFDRVEAEYSTLTKLLVMAAICLRVERGSLAGGEEALNMYYLRFGTRIKPLTDTSILLIYRFIKEWD
jgi:DNA-directed RNA polymerase subunit RPC12/RpoP